MPGVGGPAGEFVVTWIVGHVDGVAGTQVADADLVVGADLGHVGDLLAVRGPGRAGAVAGDVAADPLAAAARSVHDVDLGALAFVAGEDDLPAVRGPGGGGLVVAASGQALVAAARERVGVEFREAVLVEDGRQLPAVGGNAAGSVHARHGQELLILAGRQVKLVDDGVMIPVARVEDVLVIGIPVGESIEVVAARQLLPVAAQNVGHDDVLGAAIAGSEEQPGLEEALLLEDAFHDVVGDGVSGSPGRDGAHVVGPAEDGLAVRGVVEPEGQGAAGDFALSDQRAAQVVPVLEMDAALGVVGVGEPGRLVGGNRGDGETAVDIEVFPHDVGDGDRAASEVSHIDRDTLALRGAAHRARGYDLLREEGGREYQEQKSQN